jgi:hypothetical protein
VEDQNLTVTHDEPPLHSADLGLLKKTKTTSQPSRSDFGYNFIKIHRTLRVTPAMAVGVTDRLWDGGRVGGRVGS